MLEGVPILRIQCFRLWRIRRQFMNLQSDYKTDYKTDYWNECRSGYPPKIHIANLTVSQFENLNFKNTLLSSSI